MSYEVAGFQKNKRIKPEQVDLSTLKKFYGFEYFK